MDIETLFNSLNDQEKLKLSFLLSKERENAQFEQAKGVTLSQAEKRLCEHGQTAKATIHLARRSGVSCAVARKAIELFLQKK